eukprot:TRINITY_DN9299_c0_g1_i3.p1 TRINITY_DN9299_c0_g1~~TRINITY_DN9299_c0_g1_i3.p1  ORF type:complete len:135 (+),score=18.18 TRINITY_DN9299_c0_g1_i3:49-453(+)
MLRKLKPHEKRLLKKTDFLKYKEEGKSHEDQVIRNYYLQNREDYKKYNKLTGEVTSLIHHIRYLKPNSKVRIQITQQLLDKLFSMGVVNQKGMQWVEVATLHRDPVGCRQAYNSIILQTEASRCISKIEDGANT